MHDETVLLLQITVVNCDYAGLTELEVWLALESHYTFNKAIANSLQLDPMLLQHFTVNFASSLGAMVWHQDSPHRPVDHLDVVFADFFHVSPCHGIVVLHDAKCL